ncbi:hypothetical protein KDJ56_22090 (plasmid) [Brevibacillus composti]|uniref:Uncharacterized protein n=1 Tax=Brevibacillus composti TaxID=2796470 RepID=A0A7T5EQ91_9BACL|nr:hypothetical protein [Brevibacillus composti]QQE76762.1 hypothetical protein JD108_22120 [Brevibacillus composti]QUO43819.1 hypothetical protein KDJ56_22090 [Brevibacillus composti]
MKKGLLIAVTLSFAVLTGSLVYSQIGKPQLPESKEEPIATTASDPLEGYKGLENVQPIQSVQVGGTTQNGVTYGGIAWNGLVVGYTGKYKQIAGSSQVLIPRLGGDTFGLIETNVTVKRLGYNGQVVQTLTGKALVFASLRDTVNAGYVMVSQEQAPQWVKVLNGNPNYVFDPNRSNIYSYKITDQKTMTDYVAYSLADLAIASGGAGDPPPGDGLTKINDDLYLKRDGFKATPRPVGGISVGPAVQSLAAAPMASTLAATPNTASRSLSAASSDGIPSGLKPRYVDESGKHFADMEDLLLVFGKFDGLEDKRYPMVFSKTGEEIYEVKKLEKEKVTITVGGQIGKIIRIEGNRVFFHLYNFPELEGAELSIELQ